MLLGICAALVALLWIPASRLQLDESIESFYAQNDPYLLAYQPEGLKQWRNGERRDIAPR